MHDFSLRSQWIWQAYSLYALADGSGPNPIQTDFCPSWPVSGPVTTQLSNVEWIRYDARQRSFYHSRFSKSHITLCCSDMVVLASICWTHQPHMFEPIKYKWRSCYCTVFPASNLLDTLFNALFGWNLRTFLTRLPFFSAWQEQPQLACVTTFHVSLMWLAVGHFSCVQRLFGQHLLKAPSEIKMNKDTPNQFAVAVFCPIWFWSIRYSCSYLFGADTGIPVSWLETCQTWLVGTNTHKIFVVKNIVRTMYQLIFAVFFVN